MEKIIIRMKILKSIMVMEVNMNVSKINKKLSAIIVIFTIIVIVLYSFYSTYKNISKNTFRIEENLSVKYNSTLLLGLRNDIDKDTTTYRTLWIAPDENNKLKVMGQLNYIIVPHKDCFWKIEPIRYNFTNTNDYVEYLVAHSISESYTPETFEYKFETYGCKLNFVDRNFVAISTSYNNHKESQKNYINKFCGVTDIEKLSNYRYTEDTITLEDVFKEKSSALIKKYRKEKIISSKPLSNNSVNTTSGSNWNIERQDGKWVTQIAKTFKYSENNNDYILYNTKLKLPQSIAYYDELCTDFSKIKKYIPDAVDAISSPEKNLIGIFTKNTLTFYPYFQDKIGKDSLNIKLEDGEKMIMAQWATDNSIKSWENTLKNYFTNN